MKNNLLYKIEYNCNPFYNMAVDEYLLQSVSVGRVNLPILRLYTWSPVSISVGYHQNIDNNIVNSGFPIVRRRTGGRAIIHSGDLTYSFISRLDLFDNRSISYTYRKISQILLKGLTRVSPLFTMESRHKKREEIYKSSVCFQSTSFSEITCNGKKNLGSAQYRNKIALLQQGTMLLDNSSIDLYNKMERIDGVTRNFTSLENEKISYKLDDIVFLLLQGFNDTFAN